MNCNDLRLLCLKSFKFSNCYFIFIYFVYVILLVLIIDISIIFHQEFFYI